VSEVTRFDSLGCGSVPLLYERLADERGRLVRTKRIASAIKKTTIGGQSGVDPQLDHVPLEKLSQADRLSEDLTSFWRILPKSCACYKTIFIERCCHRVGFS
jgi:hypothetical protein